LASDERMDLVAALPELLPLATAWAESQAALILAQGNALSAPALDLARLVGVARPEDVRILLVPRVPAPDHPVLQRACAQIGFLGPGAIGLTIGHGLFLRHDFEGDRILLAHELRHVAQYEQQRSIAKYLAVYFAELLQHGYDRAPFEIDACEAAARAIREVDGRG
jgi:hypothetical protein